MHGKASLDDPATDAGLGLPPTPIDIVQSDLDFLRYGISYLSLKTRVSRSGERSASTEARRNPLARSRFGRTRRTTAGRLRLNKVAELARSRACVL